MKVFLHVKHTSWWLYVTKVSGMWEKKSDVWNEESPLQIDEYWKVITFFGTLFCTFVDNLCLFDS